ncbi:tetratricopeptide repeat protein [Chengkuizengella axinellae]|uniref:Tetratricopeptide repeat protein n=1 Tax=Chengkuizengella axinellae TaxID=3064388 RepID=A0ABT9IZQ6_9BACL|nr:tetratricopeptide repeat protein [Chengkuizengella sp. 2205SS18-9]MDP5274855.1 tetratricopeptide repeat protein [Chengkuizengella sp. 2205SS18-9]
MNSIEVHTQHLLAKIFGVLIGHYTNHNVEETDKLYDVSKRVINEDSIHDHYHKDFIYLYRKYGNYFFTKQLYEKANYYLTKAERLIEDEFSMESAKFYYNISIVKQRILEDKSLSLIYSKKALHIFEMNNFTMGIIKTMITIAVQYHLMDRLEESLKYLNTAQERLEEKERIDFQLQSSIEYNIGRVYQKMEDDELAIFHFEKAIDIIDSLEVKKDKIYSYNAMLEIYLKKKNWEKVDHYLSIALEIANINNLSYLYVELNGIKAQIYKSRGDELYYEKQMKKTIDLALQESQTSLVTSLAEELANYYYEYRFYKKASDYYRISNGIIE